MKLDDGSSRATQLNVSDVLSYARQISYMMFAPPEFGAGQNHLRGSLPPAPQEEQMRASQLYKFANLDVGLRKTVGRTEKTTEAIMEFPPLSPIETNQTPNLGELQGSLPPNIIVPAGWRPGIPVELPIDSSMPHVLNVPEQQLHKPQEIQEPIQVRHVELDIIDDQSDDSSSDEGSSANDDDDD